MALQACHGARPARRHWLVLALDFWREGTGDERRVALSGPSSFFDFVIPSEQRSQPSLPLESWLLLVLVASLVGTAYFV